MVTLHSRLEAIDAFCAFVTVLLIILISEVVAQDSPVLSSPEVRADRTVSFKFWAPRASEVKLSGNWMGPQPPIAMTKEQAGVWTATAGPFEPNLCGYTFLGR